MIEGAWYLVLLCGLAAWAGARIANWQDDRERERRLERLTGELLDEVSAEIQKVAEATEEVNRARQQERRND